MGSGLACRAAQIIGICRGRRAQAAAGLSAMPGLRPVPASSVIWTLAGNTPTSRAALAVAPHGRPLEEPVGAGQLGQAAGVNQVLVVLLGDQARHAAHEDIGLDQVDDAAGDEGGRQHLRGSSPNFAHGPDCTVARSKISPRPEPVVRRGLAPSASHSWSVFTKLVNAPRKKYRGWTASPANPPPRKHRMIRSRVQEELWSHSSDRWRPPSPRPVGSHRLIKTFRLGTADDFAWPYLGMLMFGLLAWAVYGLLPPRPTPLCVQHHHGDPGRRGGGHQGAFRAGSPSPGRRSGGHRVRPGGLTM